MKKQLFTGSGVAIITPMNADGSVNFEELSRLIEFQIQNSTDAIVICGTTGEASTLNDEEHLAVIEHCVTAVNKRVPVIAGTGANDTRHAIALSKGASERGVDGILQVTPYYNKTNQSGLIKHFLSVVEAVELPTILYNVPGRTGMGISVSTYKELSRHPLVFATKEASGDISHIANIAAECGDELGIYSGNDDQILPILSLGGLGIISVMANVIPKEVHELCALFFEGRVKESLELQLQYMALNNALFCEVNPIPVKKAVNLLGYSAGECRMPLGEMSPQNIERLSTEMARLGLLK